MHANTTYATSSDYVNSVGGGPAPAELTRSILIAASRRIDRALIGAIYAQDEDGIPTDCDIAAALTAATCAQVEYMLDQGDDGSGTGGGFSQLAIGSVRISRDTAGGTASGVDVSNKALDILTVAGLYPVNPYLRG